MAFGGDTRETASPVVSKDAMKALSTTPSRWFDTVFEVPVIRRMPRCRQAFPAQAQTAASRLRRRRLRLRAKCASNQRLGLMNEAIHSNEGAKL